MRVVDPLLLSRRSTGRRQLGREGAAAEGSAALRGESKQLGGHQIGRAGLVKVNWILAIFFRGFRVNRSANLPRLCHRVNRTILSFYSISLKQKFPNAFQDLCLYSEICHLMASYKFRLSARRFIQELFMDLTFTEVRVRDTFKWRVSLYVLCYF